MLGENAEVIVKASYYKREENYQEQFISVLKAFGYFVSCLNLFNQELFNNFIQVAIVSNTLTSLFLIGTLFLIKILRFWRL